jgi:rod shape determining protein RodA
MQGLIHKETFKYFKRLFKNTDSVLICSVILVSLAGLFTMSSFTPIEGRFFERQIIWIIISISAFFFSSMTDWSFLRRTRVIVFLFTASVVMLSMLFIFGSSTKGAISWFNFGTFSFQPIDPIKLVVIIILSKYFSKRHIEIANIRHILISGAYSFIIFFLVFLQPDFGSAVIIFLLWLGMVLVSGISKKHLLAVALLGVVSFGGLWLFVFRDYQKDRIVNFIYPLADIRGSGYNAYQSVIAVGSGQIFGKGIGYGTQSKLQFLPEYETDFIFAAFAEEWGFVGVLLLLTVYGIIFWRMLFLASRGNTNFETLFGLGLTLLFFIHAFVHIGTNIGLLPVTGNTMPFMSYGGSHLLTEYIGLGMLCGMSRSLRPAHRSYVSNEMVGISQK